MRHTNVHMRLSIWLVSWNLRDETLRDTYLPDHLSLLLGLPLKVGIIAMETFVRVHRPIMNLLQSTGSPGSASLADASIIEACLAGAGTRRDISLQLASDWKSRSVVERSSHVTGHVVPNVKASWNVLGIPRRGID